MEGSSTGPTIAETNQRLEIWHPEDSCCALLNKSFVSVCKLGGDYDVEVGYELLIWPVGNQIRTVLQTPDLGLQVGRVSFTTTEEFFVGWTDGLTIVSATGNTAGKVRFKRVGNQSSAYYSTGGPWVFIISRTVNTSDTTVALDSGVSPALFGGEEVMVAFGDLIVRAEQFICP